MLHLRKIALLRTELRNVNVEYSALVRGDGEGRLGRMEELRIDRATLMALIAETTRRPVREAHQAAASQRREATIEHAA